MGALGPGPQGPPLNPSLATRKTLFSTPPNRRPQARVAANSPGTPRCTQSTILMFMSGKSNKGGKVGGNNQESEARLAQE